MTMLTLAQVQTVLPGSTLIGDGALPFDRVHSDTRSVQPGDLFVALRGERFDALSARSPSAGSPRPVCRACWWTTACRRCSSSPPRGGRACSCR
jgi:hypothetical protein